MERLAEERWGVLLGAGDCLQAGRCSQVVGEMLADPLVMRFASFVQCQNVKNLENNFPNVWNTLSLFVNGSFSDYQSDSSIYEQLNEKQLRKLKELTLIDMCSKGSILHYQSAMESLEISNIRELEDLLIHLVSLKFIKVVLNQKEQYASVTRCSGREFSPEDIPFMLNKLVLLNERCKEWTGHIDEQLQEIKRSTDKETARNEQFKTELANLSTKPVSKNK